MTNFNPHPHYATARTIRPVTWTQWLAANWAEVTLSTCFGLFLIALTIGVALWAGWHFPEARREACYGVAQGSVPAVRIAY